jgi:hypothetical protein
VMKKSGFKKIKIYRRHNYSWTIISQKWLSEPQVNFD